jgi:hypothetical protein
MNLLSAGGPIQSNPFVILTFIVAPAILTNASALMVTSTGNRFARAIDRARSLSRQIEVARKNNDTSLDRLGRELLLTEKRAVLLLKAIRTFYFSLGAFAFGAFVALVGAGLVNLEAAMISRIFAATAVITVFLAVGGLVVGSVLLFRESRITVGIIQDRIDRLNQSWHLPTNIGKEST